MLFIHFHNHARKVIPESVNPLGEYEFETIENIGLTGTLVY